MYLSYFTIISLESDLGLHLKIKTWTLFTKRCFVPSLVKIYLMVLANIFKYRKFFFALSSLWKNLNKLVFFLPKNVLCSFSLNCLKHARRGEGFERIITNSNRWRILKEGVTKSQMQIYPETFLISTSTCFVFFNKFAPLVHVVHVPEGFAKTFKTQHEHYRIEIEPKCIN